MGIAESEEGGEEERGGRGGKGEEQGVGDAKKNSGPMECRLLSTYQSDGYSASRVGSGREGKGLFS